MVDPWPMIEADRTALAEYLSGLSKDEWQKQSLCAGWTVEQVAAHMLVVTTVPAARVFLTFLSSGFNLKRFSDKMIERITSEKSSSDIASTMRNTASSQRVPPGLKPLGVLSEVLVHSGDISEAVGRPLHFPADHYVTGLDYLKDVQSALGCRKRIEGLRLSATDANWSHGDGPNVEGATHHLIMAMTGRKAALDHLSGPGVETLRTRD